MESMNSCHSGPLGRGLPAPATRLLSSPAHLLFQLVKLTTLPYMLVQLATAKQPPPDPPLPSKSPERPVTAQRSRLQCLSTHTLPRSIRRPFCTSSSPAQPRLATASRIHALLRSSSAELPPDHPEAAELTALLSNLEKPKRATLSWSLLKLRPTLLSKRLQPVPKPSPYAVAKSWQATSVSKIVDAWSQSYLQHLPHPLTLAQSDQARLRYFRQREIAKRRKRQQFLEQGPEICACTRPAVRFLGSSPDDHLFKFFLLHIERLDLLGRARFIDICLARRRWDLAARLMIWSKDLGEGKLKSRLMRQRTGLLMFLRSTTDDLRTSPQLQRAVLCILASQQQDTIHINKLTMDVICRFAAQQTVDQSDHINPLVSRTRRLCRQFLKKLVVLIQKGKETHHRALPRWLLLRLLDHSAQHDSPKTFELLLGKALSDSHQITDGNQGKDVVSSSNKLVRAVLKALGRPGFFKIDDEQTIKRLVGQLKPSDDLRCAVKVLPEKEALELCRAVVMGAGRLSDVDDDGQAKEKKKKLVGALLERFPHRKVSELFIENSNHHNPAESLIPITTAVKIYASKQPETLEREITRYLFEGPLQKKQERVSRDLWKQIHTVKRFCEMALQMGGQESSQVLGHQRHKKNNWKDLKKGFEVNCRIEREVERRRLPDGIELKYVKRVCADRVACETVW